MRMSDWSSDVCSSDLDVHEAQAGGSQRYRRRILDAQGQAALLLVKPHRDAGILAAAQHVLVDLAIDVVIAVQFRERAFRGGDAAAASHLVVEHALGGAHRSEEHTSELQSLMRLSYAV